MTEAQVNKLNEMVAQAVAAAMAAQVKAAPVTDNGSTVNPQLAKRHASILAGFKRKGYKDAKLFTDIKPYKKWLEEGRQVRKGEKSVRGLFHVKQTDPIAKKAN
jgi:hypothetical protein